MIRTEPHPSFGKELGEMIFLIEKEIFRLNSDWQTYRSLFGAGEERFNFLFSDEVPMMHLLEDVLWHRVILGLSRLTDNRRSHGHEVLCLDQLPPLVESVELSRQIRLEIKMAKKLVGDIRSFRSQRVAHRNLDVAKSASLLPPLSRSQFQAAIEGVTKPIITIYREIADTTLLPVPTNASEEAVRLIGLLYDGLAVKRDLAWMGARPSWTLMGKWDH